MFIFKIIYLTLIYFKFTYLFKKYLFKNLFRHFRQTDKLILSDRYI